MQKFGSSKPYGFWQEDFKRFKIFLSFVAMATRIFDGIKFLKKNAEEDHGRNISVEFHQNPMSSFKVEDV